MMEWVVLYLGHLVFCGMAVGLAEAIDGEDFVPDDQVGKLTAVIFLLPPVGLFLCAGIMARAAGRWYCAK